MKKIVFIAAAILLPIQILIAQKNYITNSGHVSFFSEAPISDVDARNDYVKVEFDIATNEVTFNIAMTDFKFKNRKMGRDARRNYIEIDKFPTAGFKGKITGKINYQKTGSYPATATGKLKIHGVEREITEKGTVIVKKDQISLQSEFRILFNDYNIETPKILGQKMTKDNVLVRIDATLTEQTNLVSKKKKK